MAGSLRGVFGESRPLGNQRVIAQQLADELREAIVAVRLRPGERLVESELATVFRVSRSPLREAFLQLQKEGLVSLIPRKGAVVSEVTLRDVRELYELKGMIEAYGAYQLAANRDAMVIEKMDAMMHGMQQAAAQMDLPGYLNVLEELYCKMLSACDNRRLEAIYEAVRVPIKRIRALTLGAEGALSRSVAKHRAIFEAIKAGDPYRAEQLAREHNHEVSQIILNDPPRGIGP